MTIGFEGQKLIAAALARQFKRPYYVSSSVVIAVQPVAGRRRVPKRYQRPVPQYIRIMTHYEYEGMRNPPQAVRVDG